MSWTEQTEEMLKSWTEAQKRVWDGWTDAARKPDPAAPGLWTDWFSQWQQTAQTAAAQWGADGVPKAVIGRLFAGEEALLRFVDLALGTFKTIAPGLDAGQDWAELLRRYLDQLKEEMARRPSAWMTPEGVAAATRDLPELWKLYVAQLQKLGMPWVQSVREARGHLGEAVGGDRQAAVKLLNTFLDNYEAMFGKFLGAPAIGYSREMNEKLLKGFEAWTDYRRTSLEFDTELVGTGFRALEELLRELVETAEKGQKVTNFRQLFDLWVASSERAYFELFNTDSFAELQGRLVNSAMRCKIREREIVEEVQSAFSMPSRSEIDGIHRRVQDLRDEVKALKRELALLQKAQTAVAPPAPPAPAGTPKRPRPRGKKKV